LPNDLHKRTFESIEKTILYKEILDCEYYIAKGAGTPQKIELKDISKNIMQDKEADCDIFATVVNIENSKEVFFNCQIIKSKESKELIIHCIQNHVKVRNVQSTLYKCTTYKCIPFLNAHFGSVPSIHDL
jgi:hypothetical protein